jgi:RimJ/RimL family protein N-acetyltransferase
MTMHGAMPARIEAARLYLRPYQAGDGEWFYAMGRRNHAHLQRYESDNVVLSIHSPEEAEALVRDLAAGYAAQDYLFLGAFDRSTDEFLAQIYAGPVKEAPADFDLGFFVDVDHEGQGYVAEAVRATLKLLFEHLGVFRVRLECDDTNLRSRRVAERCGFRLVAHCHRAKRHSDGTVSGTLHFRLLRSEWQAPDRAREPGSQEGGRDSEWSRP